MNRQMKTKKAVRQFITTVNELKPFIGLGQRRCYKDIMCCVLNIAYEQTRHPKYPGRGYVPIQYIAKECDITHANIYAARTKFNCLYGTYPDFTQLYDEINEIANHFNTES